MMRCVVIGVLLSAAFWPAISFGQPPVERKVAAPTRIDWEYATRGFGVKDAKLPAGFDSTKQKYQLFAPKGSAKDKPAPLVLFISAGDNPSGWTYWQKYCQDNGVFFASPYGAGNGTPVVPRVRIVLDVLDDVRRAYRIDPDQTYLTGFSGGGRMACAIGFALPEYFGGVVPLCGTNPLPASTHQRHAIADRLSVAFVTGEKDFNRKENEEYMFPWFREVGVRSKLFLMPNAGHVIPPASTVSEIQAWLAEDLDRRRAYRKARPQLTVGPADAPSPAEQASRWVEAAQADLNDPDRAWRGVSLLQGIASRWPKSEAADRARALLKKVGGDETLLGRIDLQGPLDEVKALSAQAKALERFGNVPRAVEAWQILAERYAGTPAGDAALANAKRLRAK